MQIVDNFYEISKHIFWKKKKKKKFNMSSAENLTRVLIVERLKGWIILTAACWGYLSGLVNPRYNDSICL